MLQLIAVVFTCLMFAPIPPAYAGVQTAQISGKMDTKFNLRAWVYYIATKNTGYVSHVLNPKCAQWGHNGGLYPAIDSSEFPVEVTSDGFYKIVLDFNQLPEGNCGWEINNNKHGGHPAVELQVTVKGDRSTLYYLYLWTENQTPLALNGDEITFGKLNGDFRDLKQLNCKLVHGYQSLICDARSSYGTSYWLRDPSSSLDLNLN